MEKTSWIKIALISMALIISGYFIGNMHKTGKAYNRTVQVKGLSEREVKADLAVWPINITLTGNNLSSLQSQIEQQNKQVYDFFKKQGFLETEINIGSININDSHANLYRSTNQQSSFRYIAVSELTVRTTDIEKLQKALSASLKLLSEGVLIGSKNEWRPVEYIFTGLNELKPSMIEEATINARKVAEKFAHDSKSKVGKIMNARQGLFTINDRDQNTPEIKIVRVVSTINYQLKD